MANDIVDDRPPWDNTPRGANTQQMQQEVDELTRLLDDTRAANRQLQQDVNEAMRLLADAREANRQMLQVVDDTTRDADAKIQAARERVANAEYAADNALNIAREEVSDAKAAADAARLKADADQREAQAKIEAAQKEIGKAQVSIQTADVKIAGAAGAWQERDEAKKSRLRAIILSSTVVAIAVVVSLYCVHLAGSAIKNAADANAKLAVTQQTFDDRLATTIAKEKADLAAATERANAREAEAVATRNLAEKTLKDALSKQDAADKAFAKALEEQKTANTTLNSAQNLEATANRKLATATEKESNAKEIETRADATMRTANETKAKAEQMMQAAVKKEAEADQKILAGTQKANERVAVAEEKARMERERRMGVEAMIKAGAPLQFPLENNERNANAWPQRKEPSSPVSSSTTPRPGYGNPTTSPKRATKEILGDVTWRWCLEKELGIENGSGKLIGEVTEMPRTGYRESLQGSLSADTGVDLSAYMGKFPRRNLLGPSDKTRKFLGDEGSDSLWSWEEWHMFRTTTDKMRDELEIPPGYTFSLPKNEVPFHYTRLDRRFMLSQTEVTQELWEIVMGNNPSRFKGAKRPVENISWEDCQNFIDKLNAMKEDLGVPLGYEFTLPWESEWEHACRAGTSTSYHFGPTSDRRLANHADANLYGSYESEKKNAATRDVEAYPANPWGLYDMHGNVWEWCQDGNGYGPLYVNGRTSLEDGFYRSRRGGSYQVFAEHCRSAYRSSGNPLEKHDDVGLRLCLAAIN